MARLHKICRLGSDSEAGESVEDKEETGEDEEDKEPDAGGLGDDGDGDGDMEGPLYPALAVVELEGEGAGVPDPEAGDVEVGDVAVALAVVPAKDLEDYLTFLSALSPVVSCYRTFLTQHFIKRVRRRPSHNSVLCLNSRDLSTFTSISTYHLVSEENLPCFLPERRSLWPEESPEVRTQLTEAGGREQNRTSMSRSSPTLVVMLVMSSSVSM